MYNIKKELLKRNNSKMLVLHIRHEIEKKKNEILERFEGT